jgi:hypothetical protein
VFGWLEAKTWFRPGERQSGMAWVISYFVEDMGPEDLLKVEREVECPALLADTDERRRQLLEMAEAAVAAPPEELPTIDPEPLPITADQWGELLESQITSWDKAMADLEEAAGSEADWAPFLRYKALQEALHWLYVVDESFGVLWKQLTDAQREALSVDADNRAAKAVENNKKLRPNLDPERDPVFTAYHRRQVTAETYKHWSDVMLAGVFHQRFYEAITWVRGQMSHAATPAPLKLVQFREGAEPRWKWAASVEFARGRVNDARRHAYDEILSGHDVTGLLSHLTMVFQDAKIKLVGALRNVS